MNIADRNTVELQPLRSKIEPQENVSEPVGRFTPQGPVAGKSSKSFKAVSLKEALEKEIEKLTTDEKKIERKKSWVKLSLLISFFIFTSSCIAIANLAGPLFMAYLIPFTLVMVIVFQTIAIKDHFLGLKLINLETEKKYYKEFLENKEFELRSELEEKIIGIMHKELNPNDEDSIKKSLEIVKKYMERERREKEAQNAAIKLRWAKARGYDYCYDELQWEIRKANLLANKAREELEALLNIQPSNAGFAGPAPKDGPQGGL